MIRVDFRMIPPDSVVPPMKPADIGGSGEEEGHNVHAEHAMSAPPGK